MKWIGTLMKHGDSRDVSCGKPIEGEGCGYVAHALSLPERSDRVSALGSDPEVEAARKAGAGEVALSIIGSRAMGLDGEMVRKPGWGLAMAAIRHLMLVETAGRPGYDSLIPDDTQGWFDARYMTYVSQRTGGFRVRADEVYSLLALHCDNPVEAMRILGFDRAARLSMATTMDGKRYYGLDSKRIIRMGVSCMEEGGEELFSNLIDVLHLASAGEWDDSVPITMEVVKCHNVLPEGFIIESAHADNPDMLDRGEYYDMIDAAGVDLSLSEILRTVPANRRGQAKRLLDRLQPILEDAGDLKLHPSSREGRKRPVAELERMERLVDGGADALARWTLARFMEGTIMRKPADKPPVEMMEYALHGTPPERLTYRKGKGAIIIDYGYGVKEALETLRILPTTVDGLRESMLDMTSHGHGRYVNGLNSLFIYTMELLHERNSGNGTV